MRNDAAGSGVPAAPSWFRPKLQNHELHGGCSSPRSIFSLYGDSNVWRQKRRPLREASHTAADIIVALFLIQSFGLHLLSSAQSSRILNVNNPYPARVKARARRGTSYYNRKLHRSNKRRLISDSQLEATQFIHSDGFGPACQRYEITTISSGCARIV